MNFREKIGYYLLGESPESLKKTFDKTAEKEEEIESVGFSNFETFSINSYYTSIYQIAADKRKLINDYRAMAMFPEVADALDKICDEAIVVDDNNEVLSLQINDEKLSKNQNVIKNLQKEFEYIIDKVLDFNTNGFTYFRKFYIEAELFAEMVINPKKPKDGIKKINVLPPETMITEQDKFGENTKFVQKIIPDSSTHQNYLSVIRNSSQEEEIEFSSEQIAYVNSGLFCSERNVYLSYLERAKIAYRQLKWLEDALIVHRLVRAPEKLAFNIDVGNLPKNKAEVFLNEIIQKYKQKKVYNPSTGEVDVGRNVISMIENFYFPKRADGSGTTVDTIGGTSNFADSIDDIMLFVKKLYKALKVPTKRLDEDSGNEYYPRGAEGTVNREEIEFSKYVQRVRVRFSDFVYQVFVKHLELIGLWKQYKLTKDQIVIQFNVENEWRESKKLANFRERLELFAEALQYTPGEEEQKKVYSLEYLQKTILRMSDDEIQEMKKQMEKETKELEPIEEPEDGGETGDGEKAPPEKEKEPEEENEILQSSYSFGHSK